MDGIERMEENLREEIKDDLLSLFLAKYALTDKASEVKEAIDSTAKHIGLTSNERTVLILKAKEIYENGRNTF